MKPYLLLYNLSCAAGWGYCVAKGAQALAQGTAPEHLYDDIRDVLVGVQSLMLLDIVHALLGLVRSPVLVVFVQVMSRIFVIWGQTDPSREAQSHWSLYLIVLSWGVTETVRYLFYAFTILGGVPYPLFWLRYSLFIVLYPTGITGEIMQTLTARHHWASASAEWGRLSLIILLLYLPGSPSMIGNMWSNRKNALKKRAMAAGPNQALAGVSWPKDKKGERSSTNTNKAIVAAANAAGGDRGQALAEEIRSERKWRFAYQKHLLEHVKLSLESEATALRVAEAGLAFAHETFTFVRGEEELPLKEAMARYTTHDYDTAELRGSKRMPAKLETYLNYGSEVGRPYAIFKDQREKRIEGPELRKQLDRWVAHGCIEADVAAAIKLVQTNQHKWLDLRDTYFVLLGASSAMGPLHFLLSLGANLICVDLDRSFIWDKIFAACRDSPGRIIFPVKKGTDWKGLIAGKKLDELSAVSGSNLMTATPEISAWLKEVAPGKRLVAGAYVYLTGALFPQITLACDAIIEQLCEARPDTALASLCTPTDAHVVTPAAAAKAEENYRKVPKWQKTFENLGFLKRNRMLREGDFQFVDGIVPDQGPNYIVSKRIQHWRSIVARSKGHTVSSNVAPSTATASVVQNKSFAAAYSGMHLFAAMEVVYQELSLSAMGVLLIHDIRNPQSAANPAIPLAHPLCLMQATQWHGGVCQCPYTIATIGIPSAIIYFFKTNMGHFVNASLLMFFVTEWIVSGNLPWPLDRIMEWLG